MQSVYPLVSIITVNYNGLYVTRDLLVSLQKVTYPALEIIVVDNASDEFTDSLLTEFPYIKLIKNNRNKGFAGANNDGFKAATGEYFFMLNNDTEVGPGFIEPLIDTFTKPGVGVVCPKIKYFDQPDLIQFAGYTPINRYTGRGFPIGEKEIDDGRYDKIYQTSRGHGAAMLIKREVYEKVGPMAEDYFLYYEEMDYCERIKRNGYEIWYNGLSVVYHKESVSVGPNSALKVYYLTRNRILFMRRNAGPAQRFVFYLYYLSVIFPVHTFKYAIRSDFVRLKAFNKGILWNFIN